METILFDVADGVATITLNRPDKLNSFTARMHAELREAFDRIEGDAAIRAVLITGAGRGFCAGQDLADEETRLDDLAQTLERNYNALVKRMQALDKPIIAAVNGVAAGAGANLAFACDLTLAARSVSFIQAFVKIGLLPDCGGTWLLPQRVGMQRALGLALTGDKLSAAQAEDWGLIWKCLDDEALLPEARKLAAHLATQPTKAIGAIKRALYGAWSRPLAEQLDVERDGQAELGRSADFREGVQAFLDKRAPRFTGA